MQGVAIHIGPEPCADVRKGAGEASVGERTGQALNRDRTNCSLNDTTPGHRGVECWSGAKGGNSSNCSAPPHDRCGSIAHLTRQLDLKSRTSSASSCRWSLTFSNSPSQELLPIRRPRFCTTALKRVFPAMAVTFAKSIGAA